MGTDLPSTSPLMGAIVRGVPRVFFIRSRLLDSTDWAGDLRAGRQSRPGNAGVSTSTGGGVGKATHRRAGAECGGGVSSARVLAEGPVWAGAAVPFCPRDAVLSDSHAPRGPNIPWRFICGRTNRMAP